MLGYAAVRAAARTRDDGLKAFGLRQLRYVAQRPQSHVTSPSVFEVGATAAAYNLLDPTADEPVRTRLAEWLAGAPAVFVVDGSPYRGNKYLVEAHALLELCRSAIRPDRTVVCARGRSFIERAVPTAARVYTVQGSDGRDVTILSDPPVNPIAYHALVAGYYARSLTLLPQPTAASRKLLARFARGLVALAAPDGDIAYWGRSQQQGWSLLLGAYALREAAHHVGRDEAARFEATALILLDRYARLHDGGPYGTFITPVFATAPAGAVSGLDDYANAATYSGLTAMALCWLADQPRGRFVGQSPRTVRSIVLGRSQGTFAIGGNDRAWFAVRQHGSRDGDLRYDFGIVAGKARRDGRWSDLIAARPITADSPDSAGPILHSHGRVGYPGGGAIRIGDDGTILVVGGWRTTSGRWLRRATFAFQPTRDGVRMQVPVRRGDRIVFSVFAHAPSVHGATVIDADRRAKLSQPASVQYERGYASATDSMLTRIRLTTTVRRGERLTLAFTTR